MFIYNTTFNIENTFINEVLTQIEEQYIPDILGTALFTKALFTEVLHNSTEGTKTYSLQLFCPSENHFKQYQEFHEHKLVALTKPFNGKVVYFQTLMQIKSIQDNS